ncbi:MAG: 4-(cytidine 5'-diphospho)-2-C-methyl-D-erythritol kinase [Syntrophomonadaceae bacterium]|jgi:4-diphosphocytidyl-2-C-methyl-D-erythritol kinase
MKSPIIVEAPAKVNFFLNVTGKRPDGYHELQTVMHQVELKDLITLEVLPSGIEIESDSREIPLNETNLAYKAAKAFFGLCNLSCGVRITIEKNIPVGAGLAGGSTDAAAVLKGLSRLFPTAVRDMALPSIAASIGSDVPFCLLGGSALAKGRGEILFTLKHIIFSHILLVKPPFAVSTAETYQRLDNQNITGKPDLYGFLEAWNECDIISLAGKMANVLEAANRDRFPVIEEIKEKMKRWGAINALMSGSGPTVLGVFNDPGLAADAKEKFENQYQEVFLISSYKNRGE